MSYLDELSGALGRVGIRGRLRARILAEAADHVAEGGSERFGDPDRIAQLFADELATAGSTQAAFRAFGALAVAGAAFAAGWLLVKPAGGWPDVFSAETVPLGLLAALGMLVCSQVAFAAGLLAVLRAFRLRHARVAPAAEIAVLVRRTAVALAFGAVAMLSQTLYAVEFRAQLASWYSLGVGIGSAVLTLPLLLVALRVTRVAQLRPTAPGPAGDMFDDFPVSLPRRPWTFCLVLAALVAVLALIAEGGDEGPRNAAVEAILVVGCFAVLGRLLGLRAKSR